MEAVEVALICPACTQAVGSAAAYPGEPYVVDDVLCTLCVAEQFSALVGGLLS